MENRNVIIAVTLLALIVVGMFVFTYLKKQEIKNNDPIKTDEVVAGTVPYAQITRIDAKHFFDGKTHTLAGEILMPTPCDLLNWDTRVAESNPEQIIVDFNVVNHSETCTQMVTPQRFKVSFDASEKSNIRATLAGRFVELNLISASPDESPDDFELFIKG